MGIDTSCSCDLRVPREPRIGLRPRADAGDERGSTDNVTLKKEFYQTRISYRQYHQSC